jgi:hypothetical protein
VSAPATAPQRIPRRVPRPDATTPRARHLALVDTEARRHEVRRRWIVRTWGLAIVLAALVGVMAHALMAQGEMRSQRVQAALTAEERRYEDARYAVAHLASPESVVARAAQLGMVAVGARRTVEVPGVGSMPDRAASAATAADQAVKRATREP